MKSILPPASYKSGVITKVIGFDTGYDIQDILPVKDEYSGMQHDWRKQANTVEDIFLSEQQLRDEHQCIDIQCGQQCCVVYYCVHQQEVPLLSFYTGMVEIVYSAMYPDIKEYGIQQYPDQQIRLQKWSHFLQDHPLKVISNAIVPMSIYTNPRFLRTETATRFL